MGRRRSFAGDMGVGVFIIAFVCTVIACFSPSWLVSDERYGSNFERLGLWEHCFNSLPDPYDEYQRRFFVGCRWIYNPYTFGYDELRGFLMPPFIIVTQIFYALSFVLVLASFVCVLLYFLCFGPNHKHVVKLVAAIAVAMLAAGICGVIAVSVFAIWANRDDWMIGHDYNYFGWTFVVAIIGSIASLIAGGIFFVETTIQRKKRNNFKESRQNLQASSPT